MSDPLGNARATAAKRQEKLAALTPAQRSEVQRLYLTTAWDWEVCYRMIRDRLPAAPPEDQDRYAEALSALQAGRQTGPLTVIARAALRALIRIMLRTFSETGLRQLYTRATAELSPGSAETARELIRRELSRRLRKDY